MENRTIKIIGTWFGAVIALVFIGVFMALPTMWLWNSCLVPALDSVRVIDFWQALGINILSSILFKASNTRQK